MVQTMSSTNFFVGISIIQFQIKLEGGYWGIYTKSPRFSRW